MRSRPTSLPSSKAEIIPAPGSRQGVLRMGEAPRLQNVVYSEVDGDMRVRGIVANPGGRCWRSGPGVGIDHP